MQPDPQRPLAVLLIPPLPGAGKRIVGGVDCLVGVAQDTEGHPIDVRCVLAVGLINRTISKAGFHHPKVRAGVNVPCINSAGQSPQYQPIT